MIPGGSRFTASSVYGVLGLRRPRPTAFRGNIAPCNALTKKVLFHHSDVQLVFTGSIRRAERTHISPMLLYADDDIVYIHRLYASRGVLLHSLSFDCVGFLGTFGP